MAKKPTMADVLDGAIEVAARLGTATVSFTLEELHYLSGLVDDAEEGYVLEIVKRPFRESQR